MAFIFYTILHKIFCKSLYNTDFLLGFIFTYLSLFFNEIYFVSVKLKEIKGSKWIIIKVNVAQMFISQPHKP